MNITVGIGSQLLFAIMHLKSLLPAAFYQCKEYFVEAHIPLCLHLLETVFIVGPLLTNTTYKFQISIT